MGITGLEKGRPSISKGQNKAKCFILRKASLGFFVANTKCVTLGENRKGAVLSGSTERDREQIQELELKRVLKVFISISRIHKAKVHIHKTQRKLCVSISQQSQH